MNAAMLKKLFLIILFLPLLSATCHPQGKVPKDNTNSKKARQTKTEEARRDTQRIVVDSILYGRQEIKVDEAFKNTLTQAIKETSQKDEYDKLNFWIQIVLLLAAVAASFFAYRSLRKTQVSLERDKKYRDLAFIAEVDKLLIEHPELWAYEKKRDESFFSGITIKTPLEIEVPAGEKIWFITNNKFEITALTEDVRFYVGNNNPTIISKNTQSGTCLINNNEELIIEANATIKVINQGEVRLQSQKDKLLDAKIDAFCYYKLNNLELALNEHGEDKDAKKCWEEYLVYIYDNSTPFHKIIDNILNTSYGNIYNKKFVKQIDEILKAYKRI